MTIGVCKALKEAGERCFSYLSQYGVSLKWYVSDEGFRLKGQYGADKCEKTLYWSDTDDFSLSKDMQDLEGQVLRGLSN